MSKLFCDCKTDEEKSNFFLSGQGVETGIIAPAISNEVAMAFHRCFEFEKQLAAALAACKMKDELITDACTAIAFYGEQPPQELFDALSMPCADSALKAWLGEPVARLIPVSLPDGDRVWARTFEEYSQESSEKNVHRNGLEIPLYSPKGLK